MTDAQRATNQRPDDVRSVLVRACADIVGADATLSSFEERLAYDVDGFTLEKHPPDVIVLPRTTEEVSELLKVAARLGVPLTARGAGTGLAGGALPAEGGLLLSTARMDRILALEADDRFAIVQPGVVNLHLSHAAAPFGLHYAPDPSSQMASTLGGNASTNAGGPHCLKYGLTHAHVLGLTFVLVDGTVVIAGGPACDPPGLDLVGAMVGTEGTCAVVTELIVRLTRVPESVRTFLAVFDTVEAA